MEPMSCLSCARIFIYELLSLTDSLSRCSALNSELKERICYFLQLVPTPSFFSYWFTTYKSYKNTEIRDGKSLWNYTFPLCMPISYLSQNYLCVYVGLGWWWQLSVDGKSRNSPSNILAKPVSGISFLPPLIFRHPSFSKRCHSISAKLVYFQFFCTSGPSHLLFPQSETRFTSLSSGHLQVST